METVNWASPQQSSLRALYLPPLYSAVFAVLRGGKTQEVAALSQNLIYSQNLCFKFHSQRLEMQLHIDVLVSFA